MSLSVKEESLEEFKNFFKKILPETRSFEGCQGVQLYQNKESITKFTIHAKWVSEEAQKKYLSWRVEKGSFDILQPMLSEPLGMQYYDIIDE